MSVANSVDREVLVINPHSLSYQLNKLGVFAGKCAINFMIAGIGNYILQESSFCLWGCSGHWLWGAAAFASIEMYKWRQFTPAELMSASFYEELEVKNNEKDIRAPLALIELAEHDHNRVFSLPSTQAAILQIANDHRVAIRTVRKVNEVGTTIRSVSNAHGPVESLYIGAHGCPVAMQLGEKSWFNNTGEYLYKISDLHKDLLNDMAGMHVYFISCSTGPALAPTVAKAADKNVWAAMTAAYPRTLLFYPCPLHGIDMNFHLVDEWDEWQGMHGKQDVRIFHGQSAPSDPCPNAEAIQAALAEKLAILEKRGFVAQFARRQHSCLVAA